MKKIPSIFLFLFGCILSANAQEGQGTGRGADSSSKVSTSKVSTAKTAPVKWERYKISGKNISVNFPKMPFKISSSNLCNNIESETFGTYAKQRAYVFTINSKSTNPIPDSCREKKEFTEQNFINYKKEFDRSNENVSKAEKVKYSNGEVYKYRTGNRVIWLIDDYKNKSWYEFSVVGTEDSESFANFVNSLEVNSNKSAIEILEGADSTIGDAESILEEASNTETSAIVIYFKPRANYTELARKNQVQGMVTLRLTFHDSGAIGAISVATTLPDGMTEEAIKAAKRMIFKPAMKDGKPYTVTKQVQYSFTLY